MNLPFTIDQFLGVFKNYNLAVWPFQIFLNLLAVFAIIFSVKKIKIGDKLISGILGFFWLWIGIVYHLLFFTGINKGAYLFGGMFIIQGLIFIYAGVIKNYISIKFKADVYGTFGIIFILYALIIYPIIGHNLGHIYPKQPTFGLPCPTTIFTFGILLWSSSQIPKYILIIPFIWSFIGFGAALNLTILEDFGLLIAGLLGTILIIFKGRRRRGKSNVALDV